MGGKENEWMAFYCQKLPIKRINPLYFFEYHSIINKINEYRKSLINICDIRKGT